MKRKRREEEHENHERWLLTYADLITLLLAFFIMMYTFSKQDAQKYQEVTSHLRTIFSGGTSTQKEGNSTNTAINSIIPAETINSAIRKQLEEEIKNVAPLDNHDQNLTVFVDERGIVIRALDNAFFDEGKADLKENAKNTLTKIMPIVKKVNRHIRIEGHTDNVSISTRDFKSNWELSVRRATEVVRFMVEKGSFPPEKTSAVGYAEYRPLIPNTSPKNRALNRRIEIIIEKSSDMGPLGIANGAG
ncbi:MAG: chemotaxis protein MotB [Syntrophus sp. (in: bacteria)]|nr:chemotaxis protein MotB [Syntrophus sp. (in: bacteria)]